VSRRQSYTVAECRRALWLLGVVPPTDRKGVLVAWRKRVAQTHPDRHLGDAAREEAAAKRAAPLKGRDPVFMAGLRALRANLSVSAHA
jgi:hypothetical protein